MELAKYEMLFSKPRLSRYLSVCKGDIEKGLLLYKYNIQASQALYPLVSTLEVALRNAIDRELSKYFQDTSWLINQRHRFAHHPALVRKDARGNVYPDHFFTDKLDRAYSKLRHRKEPVNHVKILTELTFGFWVKFFDPCPIKILKGVPLQAFNNKPSIKLAGVHSHLRSILNLRNRISHNEPICFNKKGTLCLKTISQYESDICSAINWIDPGLNVWSKKLNFFPLVLNRIQRL